MSQIITAPSREKPLYQTVFLAGGISGCPDWQSDVIKELEDADITFYNPRRASFDVTDKTATISQIAWEYNRLEQMDIFSMYFCNSESVQPICMYELGRNVLRMQNRFPNDWDKRIIISIEKGYMREEDVSAQISLCAPLLLIGYNADPTYHAQRIKRQAQLLRR